ncbi:DEAD/DEAH box helicase [soil metagenome]
MLFSDLHLNNKLLQAIADAGFAAPLPVQAKAIPLALERRDVIGCAPTGTGKTAAFLIPVIDGLLEMPRAKRFRPRALVLSPTRELARQVAEVFEVLAKHTNLRVALLTGGEGIDSQDAPLNNGADLIVATPGRLLEHLSRGGLKFTELEYLIVDEADRLFDAGFLPEVRRIVDELPERRQTMLFSATMPIEMEAFAHSILHKPARVQIGAVGPRENIEESFYPVVEAQKTDLLRIVLAQEKDFEKVLVFVRTRKKARELAPVLHELTKLPTAELHAELSQSERNRAFDAFRSGEIQLLVATDVAARGLDIDGLSHVVNFDVPNTPDDYIHRVGRTGRVDRRGVAITLVSPMDLGLAAAIEAAVRRPIANKRLAEFLYEIPSEEKKTPVRRSRSFDDFQPRRADGTKKKPFTKSGQLIRELRPDESETKPRRNAKKRMERKIKNMKLPHQRKKGSG